MATMREFKWFIVRHSLLIVAFTACLAGVFFSIQGLIQQRELIEKAYFGDLSHSEIAEQTGLPLGTIKSRIRLALDRLRHAMK